MKKMYILAGIIIVTLISLGFFYFRIQAEKLISQSPSFVHTQKAIYGTKVKFTKDAVLEFPDFTLIYTGITTQKISDTNPLTFTYYNFVIQQGSDRKHISWSSGTGEVAPKAFNFERKNYKLELVFSEKFNRLENDELVISVAKPTQNENKAIRLANQELEKHFPKTKYDLISVKNAQAGVWVTKWVVHFSAPEDLQLQVTVTVNIKTGEVQLEPKSNK